MKKIFVGIVIGVILNYLDQHILVVKEKTLKPRFERIDPGLWMACWNRFIFVSSMDKLNKFIKQSIYEVEEDIRKLNVVKGKRNGKRSNKTNLYR